MGQIFYKGIWQPIEWIIYGQNNDSVNGKPRAFIVPILVVGAIALVLFIQWNIWQATGFIRWQPQQEITYAEYNFEGSPTVR